MRRFFISAAAFLLLFTSGCASGKIHERSYLRAAVISGDNNDSITMAFFDEDKTVSADGGDIDAARYNAELRNGRSVFTGYAELLIVDGKNCCRLLEHMLNSWKVSPSCMVVYSADGEKLLNEYSPEKLGGIAEQAVKKGIAPECDIITVLGRLSTKRCAEVVELRGDGSASSRIIY